MKNCLTTMYILISILSLSALNTDAAVTFEWAQIGNAGNPADSTTGFGSVAYEYSIAKTEVSNAQYIEFLNAVASVSDTHGLYNTSMGSTIYGGIDRTENAGSYTYSYKDGDTNWANKPVVYVSWYDILRFTNWLNNGQPTGEQTYATTEYGAYDMSQGVRLEGANYWLPNENEWYKAAYYDPDKNGTGGYWLYATQSDTAPDNNAPDADSGNSANYEIDGYAVGTPYYSTDVDAYSASASAYGTYNQDGNVWEPNETDIGGNRGNRGACWYHPGYATSEFYLSSASRPATYATYEGPAHGFRVAGLYSFGEAAVPEPASITLFALSILGILRKFFK